MEGNSISDILARALARMPGGVNSPVRSWKAVGGEPKIIAQGQGAYVQDITGKQYIDFVGSW